MFYHYHHLGQPACSLVGIQTTRQTKHTDYKNSNLNQNQSRSRSQSRSRNLYIEL